MELQDVLKKRRSIRRYLNKPVSNEDIQTVIDAAILAPSWKNSQVIRYYVVKSQPFLNEIRKALPDFNQNNSKDAPVLIVPTIVLNRSGFERDGTASTELKNEWGFYDCGLQTMNLLLKATDLGLSTLIMGIRDAMMIKDILGIDENEAVVSVIALGYGDIDPEMPKRKTYKDIVHIK